MGKKASFLPHGDIDKYLCCNADESEPGTFKDRELIHRNPHQLIEGVLVGAYAAGANQAFIYIRGEYEEQADILDAALTEAYARGYAGERILKSDFSCTLVVHRGAGAYICGEETALLDSLEGKRGNPRLKPPFPANQGLYQGPDADQQRGDALQRPAHRRERRRLVQAIRDRALAGHEGRLGLRQRAAPRQLRDRARHPRAGDHLRPGGRPAGGAAREGLVPGRLVGPGPDRGAPRPALRLRAHGRGRLDAGLGGDHRDRRLRADRVRRAAPGGVLPARVVRQVRPVPGGDELDREDAGAHRPGRGDADGPRGDGGRAGQHHRQLPVPAGRLDGDAGRLDDQALPGGVRGAYRSRRRVCRSSPCRTRPRDAGPRLDHVFDRRPRGARARGRMAPRRGEARRRRDPVLLLRAEARSARGRVPHVHGRGGGDPEAADLVLDAGQGRDGRPHPDRPREARAERGGRVPAREPPARLPGVRQGWRVPAPGHLLRLGAGPQPLRRGEAELPQADRALAPDRDRP